MNAEMNKITNVDNDRQVHILVINGSPRAKSRGRSITKKAIEILKSNGMQVTFFDVGVDILPLYKGNEMDMNHETVIKLSNLASEADGFFICTPEYHSGMSGALKNALDFLSGSHFKNKPATIAATSGGGKGGMNALNNLRVVLRGLYSIVLPGQLIADPAIFDENFELVDEVSITRLEGILDELSQMSQLLHQNKKVLVKL